MCSGDEFGVEDILDHRVNHDLLRTEFLVKWKNCDKDENTWEPLDYIYKCPVLLKELERKKRTRLVAKARRDNPNVSQETLDALGNFKAIPSEIVDKFKDPMEYKPVGNEKMGSIWFEHLSPKGNYLWCLTFENEHEPCFVRKCVVAYYWPFDAAMFLHLQVSRFEKIKRCGESKHATK